MVGGWVPAPEAALTPPEPSSAPVQPAAGPRRWAELLPDTLAGGRVDPGRAGIVGLLLLALIGSGVAASMLVRSRPHPVPLVATVDAPGAGAPDGQGGEVVVDVTGRVAAPGVRRLPPGSRVVDALEAAGGVLPDTDTAGLNLARPLRDGEQVLVGVAPVAGSAPVAGAAGSPQGPAGGLVDLNTAQERDLDGLPGVGPVTAGRILAWRESKGPFRSVDQLREVDGIGEATFARLRELVTV